MSRKKPQPVGHYLWTFYSRAAFREIFDLFKRRYPATAPRYDYELEVRSNGAISLAVVGIIYEPALVTEMIGFLKGADAYRELVKGRDELEIR